MSRIRLTEQADPSTPPANTAEIFVSSGAPGNLKVKKDDGTVVDLEAGGGVTDHGALTGLADDDHTQYQLRTEKNAASGYPGLDGSSKLTGSQQVYGTGANTACQGNDARLSDARTPLAHTHPLSDITGDGALAALNTVGTAEIDNDAVSYAKIQNVSAASRLLGRGSAGGAGDVQEITIGSGLTLSGTSLTASATAPALDDLTDVTITSPATDAALIWDGAGWVDGAPTPKAHTHTLADITDEGALASLNTVGSGQIDNDSVTYAKIQNVATDRLLGRDTAGAGDVEELTVGGGVEFTGTGIQRSALTGDVTASAGSNSTTVANDAVTFAKMQNIATDRLVGRDTAATGDPEELTVGGGLEFTGSGGIQRSALTGDVTASAGNNATTIAADAVTYAKLQNVAGFSVPGKATTGTGDAADITAADETVLGRTGAGNLAFAQVATGQVANDAITYAKLQNVTDARLLGRSAGSNGDCQEITVGSGLSLSGGALTSTVSAVTKVRLSSDQTVQSTTPEDVTGLSFSLSANTEYHFRFCIIWRSDTATVGAGFSLNGPAGFSILAFHVAITSTLTAIITNTARAYDAFAATTLSVDTANADQLCLIEGMVLNGANSGTLVVRHRLETGSAAINTVKAGSVGFLTQTS